MLESKFKTKLIENIETRFPGSMIFHLDPTEKRGAPDLLVLYQNKWAALEGKQKSKSSKRPLQPYYVDLMNRMSFARFIDPENEEEVLNAMEQSFRA